MAKASSPTMRDIAAAAGVSPAAVSLALRDHPSLPITTRRRLQKLAEKLGYKRDPVVASLMAQLRTARSRRGDERIAYFTAWDTRDGWRRAPNENNFFLGARARAARLGYELEHIWARAPGLTTARLSKILQTRAIRGIVLAPFLGPRSHVTMDWSPFAVAAISHTMVRPLVHRASHGHYNGMFLALRQLRHHGYQRIGLATRREQSERVGDLWLAALLVYQKTIPAARRVPPFLCEGVSGFSAEHFQEWVEKRKPDVVVSNLREPLDLLRGAGRRVPEDIGYASLDLPTPDDTAAGVDQQAAEVGAAAVDQVVTQLQNNEYGLPRTPRTVYLDGVWREGDTLARRPRAVGDPP